MQLLMGSGTDYAIIGCWIGVLTKSCNNSYQKSNPFFCNIQYQINIYETRLYSVSFLDATAKDAVGGAGGNQQKCLSNVSLTP